MIYNNQNYYYFILKLIFYFFKNYCKVKTRSLINNLSLIEKKTLKSISKLNINGYNNNIKFKININFLDLRKKLK